ncbi:GspH/FimT family pseudopilin [Thiohalobacter sp. IOR34]|uniref:GspH/FimT family pseudopilin n=1 Tax=Thiohalobacter sp. IOR34 TaxID=3057176 RepID=UPI0025B1E9B9|nr:GspH/FimT family pseudopilin [Thiohalobacter sp. IOR34]WJW75089.1 GspH/FimT family pseudopilin [Thiohalobacter sp. IOR34]
MNSRRGFTLIELMITIAIAAILLTVGVPSFRSIIQNNRITAQANELVTALNLGRSEAVKRGQTITVCASSTGSACTGGWPDGWLVMTDANGNAALDGTDAVLRVWEGLTGGTTVSASDTALQFDRLGALIGGNPVTINISIPDCTGTELRNITISNTGRVSVQRTTCP